MKADLLGAVEHPGPAVSWFSLEEEGEHCFGAAHIAAAPLVDSDVDETLLHTCLVEGCSSGQ